MAIFIAVFLLYPFSLFSSIILGSVGKQEQAGEPTERSEKENYIKVFDQNERNQEKCTELF